MDRFEPRANLGERIELVVEFDAVNLATAQHGESANNHPVCMLQRMPIVAADITAVLLSERVDMVDPITTLAIG